MSSSETSHTVHAGSINAMRLAALGVVFGDIATSPLYTLKTIITLIGGTSSAPEILGALSLIVWTLVAITSVKYVLLAMRVDNDGEGGILALMALLHRRPVIVALGLIGACLIYGDGAITPAISVLSAVEGLGLAVPSLKPHILSISVTILIALFALQYKGTAHIGKLFGPVMALWCVTIALLGIGGILQHPGVLIALNPYYGFDYLLTHGHDGFIMLGGVFLCVTGAEALYADMGHFGPKPIRFSWTAIVFPSLVLNYAGQSALVLEGASADNLFFRLAPENFALPLVILATVATIIASQAIITGAFSMTRQAIQLGWLPRLRIAQTSASGYGQIYVRIVNWMLMLTTVSLTIAFRKSENLASAYGIAVCATMLATTILLYVAMREVWQWSRLKAMPIAGALILIDSTFFIANLSKIEDGGYIPLVLAAIIYGAMLIWHRGTKIVSEYIQATVVPVNEFMAMIECDNVARVPGTAVFMTRTATDVPPVMAWHVRHNRALHEKLLAITVVTDSTPWGKPEHRLKITRIADNFWRATATYGFMERPNIPELLNAAQAHGCTLDLHDITYYVGHETILPTDNQKGMHYWMEILFVIMQRNSVHSSDYFRLPTDDLVEIGRQIAI